MAIYTVLTTDGRRTEIEDARSLDAIGIQIDKAGYLLTKDVTRDPNQPDIRRDAEILLFYPNIISIT